MKVTAPLHLALNLRINGALLLVCLVGTVLWERQNFTISFPCLHVLPIPEILAPGYNMLACSLRPHSVTVYSIMF